MVPVLLSEAAGTRWNTRGFAQAGPANTFIKILIEFHFRLEQNTILVLFFFFQYLYTCSSLYTC